MKRGQITIFIIVGLLIVLMVGIILYLNRGGIQATLPPQTQPIHDYIQGCLSQAATDAVFKLGSQGGHLISLNHSIQSPSGNIGYGYDGGDVLPTIPEMQDDLKLGIILQMNSCDLTLFEQQGWNITKGDISADVAITDTDVLVKLFWNLRVEQPGISVSLQSFITNVKAPLIEDYATAKAIVKKTIDNPRQLDQTFLSTTGKDITVFPADTETLVYAIHDDRLTRNGQPFAFVFGAKLPVNHPPTLDIPAELKLKKGAPYTLTVTASDQDGDKVTVDDDTFLFDLVDGKATFTPDIPGIYDITITATDALGLVTEKQFILTVQ